MKLEKELSKIKLDTETQINIIDNKFKKQNNDIPKDKRGISIGGIPQTEDVFYQKYTLYTLDIDTRLEKESQ